MGLIKDLDKDPPPAGFERLLQKPAPISDTFAFTGPLAPTGDMIGLQGLWLSDNLTTHYASLPLTLLEDGFTQGSPTMRTMSAVRRKPGQWHLAARLHGLTRIITRLRQEIKSQANLCQEDMPGASGRRQVHDVAWKPPKLFFRLVRPKG